MDSFRLLLNEIGHELTEENVQCLVHIYGVPGGSRKQIKDGLALFNYLITQDFISREKIGNLRNLLRKIRPRRKDLVRLVDNYIKKEFQTNDVSSVLDDFSDSFQLQPDFKSAGYAIFENDETAVCKLDCAYLYCVCRRVPSFYIPFIILLLIAIIVTALFWFANVPEVSDSINSNARLKKAGVFILIAEILVLLVVIVIRVREKLSSCLVCRKHEHLVLTNDQIGMADSSRSGETNTRVKGAPTSPRRYKTSQSSDSAVFSYASTGRPGSVPTFGTISMDEQQRVDLSEQSDTQI